MKIHDKKIINGPGGITCPCCTSFGGKKKIKVAINRRFRRASKTTTGRTMRNSGIVP